MDKELEELLSYEKPKRTKYRNSYHNIIHQPDFIFKLYNRLMESLKNDSDEPKWELMDFYINDFRSYISMGFYNSKTNKYDVHTNNESEFNNYPLTIKFSTPIYDICYSEEVVLKHTIKINVVPQEVDENDEKKENDLGLYSYSHYYAFYRTNREYVFHHENPKQYFVNCVPVTDKNEITLSECVKHLIEETQFYVNFTDYDTLIEINPILSNQCGNEILEEIVEEAAVLNLQEIKEMEKEEKKRKKRVERIQNYQDMRNVFDGVNINHNLSGNVGVGLSGTVNLSGGLDNKTAMSGSLKVPKNVEYKGVR